MDVENKDMQPDVKNKVMLQIKKKKIKMRSPLVFMAEKLGLESALAFSMIFGALVVSILFYFLKKTGLIKFLSMGIPGIKIFLITLPYDYIILFILSIIIAIYFANKVELFCGKCELSNSFMAYFFIGSLILGIFFAVLGVGDFLKGWSKNKIPMENAVWGKVKNFSEKEVLVEDENGNIIRIFVEMPETEFIREYEEEKFLRAVGNRDQHNKDIFHARIIRCCDEE